MSMYSEEIGADAPWPVEATRRMNRMYRRQRHIYDGTRRYYLLGRDRLIANLGPNTGADVLEIGCGTGRNLVHAARLFPLGERRSSTHSTFVCVRFSIACFGAK